MPVYATSEQSFVRVRQKIIKLVCLTVSIVLIFLFALEIWKYLSTGEADFISVILGVLLVALLSIIITSMGLNERKKVWNSFEIRLENNYISCQQIPIPEVKIDLEEIATIQESKHGLDILSQDKTRSLLIPIELDRANYLEIKIESLRIFNELLFDKLFL